MIRLLMALLLIGSFASAEELEGTEAASDVSLLASQLLQLSEELGPQGSLVVGVSTTAIFTVAAIYAKWNEVETRRRYRDAAQEAAARLATREIEPIDNADLRGSLKLVAELEQKLIKQKISQPLMANLIINHSRRMELGL